MGFRGESSVSSSQPIICARQSELTECLAELTEIAGSYKFRDCETTMKIKFAFLKGVGRGGREENCPKTLFFLGSPRKFVVIPQAPRNLKITSLFQRL